MLPTTLTVFIFALFSLVRLISYLHLSYLRILQAASAPIPAPGFSAGEADVIKSDVKSAVTKLVKDQAKSQAKNQAKNQVKNQAQQQVQNIEQKFKGKIAGAIASAL
jgi:hypothetical protein